MIPGIPLGPEPQVDADGHMALGTSSAIAKDAELGFAPVDAPPPSEEHSAPETGLSGVLIAAGAPREVIEGAVQWVQTGVAKSASELADIDVHDSAAARAELQQIWGDKYQGNVDALSRYVCALPEHEAELILSARDPATGRAYLNDPANMVRLAGLARRPQPASAGEHTIESIEKFMRSNRAAYNSDSALQGRYRQLIDARERAKDK